MDPDLDPNLQHWQDRLDNFQWVVGSLVSLLESIPTCRPRPRRRRIGVGRSCWVCSRSTVCCRH